MAEEEKTVAAYNRASWIRLKDTGTLHGDWVLLPQDGRHVWYDQRNNFFANPDFVITWGGYVGAFK